MKPYDIRFTREAAKDVEKLTARLRQRLKEILVHTLSIEPRAGKRLVGDLRGFYSFRLTYKDRIVYTVADRGRRILIHRARTHYGD